MRKGILLGALVFLVPLFVSAASCPNLTRNLSLGSRGTDVVALQDFLIGQGYLAAGNNTGYFGALTQTGVQRFQCQYMNICAGSPRTNGYGQAGPGTRTKIREVCLQVSTTTTATPFAPKSCSFNGRTIQSGESVTAYQSTTVQVGQCLYENRTCTNGTLSGAYSYDSCISTSVACTPLPAQTQTLTCPSGQSGSITQTRTSLCPGPTWSEWQTTSNTCAVVSTTKKIQTTVLDTSVPYKALFHTHDQHVVQNANGIFISYLTSYNDSTLDASWKLMRSTDGGATFTLVYSGTSEQSPPAMESDTGGNVYLIFPTQTTDSNPTSATFLKFSASNGFTSPIVTKSLPNASSKFTTLYDQFRDVIYYFTSDDSYPGTVEQFQHKNFLVISTSGDVTRAVALTEGGSAVPAGVQYPLLAQFGYDLYIAWTTDDSQAGSTPHYRDIHVIKTGDAGNNFKKLDGTLLSSAVNTPIIADETGPTDRVTLSDEFNPDTWLSGFATSNYKVHFMYDAYGAGFPERQHYVRLDAQTGARLTDIQPTWCIDSSCMLNSYWGGAFVNDLRSGWNSPVLFAVSGESDAARPVVFKSADDGETWTLYATSDSTFPTNIYTIGASRIVTSDGNIIGAFVQQNGNTGSVVFYKVSAQ